MPGSPKMYRVSDVPKFVWEKYGVRISRQTANNWTIIGRNGLKLKVVSIPRRSVPMKMTLARWISEFVDTLGL
jgi:hypothetical protein